MALKARTFRLLGGGEHGLDARHGGPGRLRGPFGLTAVPEDARRAQLDPRRPSATPLRAPTWGRVWRPQPRDAIEEAAEQLARHRHLRHLKGRYVPLGAGFPVGRKAGGYVFHNTRHSCLTNLAAAGVPDTVARSISGHRTASVHARYQITQESAKSAALAAMRVTVLGCMDSNHGQSATRRKKNRAK